MKKTIPVGGFCLLLLFTGLFLPSCNTPVKQKKIRIGFSQVWGHDLWRKVMLDEMKRELSFHDNVELIYTNTDGDSRKQIEQIEYLVSQKIDLLIVCPYESKPLTPIIEKVYDSVAPVIIMDRTIQSQNYSAFVGASNFEVGQNAGRYAVNILKGAGNVIEITGRPDESPVTDRHDGFTDVISHYPGIHFLKEYYNLSAGPISGILDTVLKQNKNIDLIFCVNDPYAHEAYTVCKKYGLENKIKIIGIDGLPDKGMGMDMVTKKEIAASVLYPTGGQEAIATAMDILEKKPFKKENKLTTTIIDSSNVRIMKMQYQKMLSQQDDIDRRQKRINEQIDIANNRAHIIIVISITLALALIFGGIMVYYLNENKKINRKLELQKQEISDQRNQLADLFAKLKEATSAKFNFFTNISHELRTPLTLIMAPLQDAMASSKLHFTIKSNLDLVHRNTMRLLRLINQLMDFRKIEENKMALHASENNLTHFVTEITSAFTDLARKKSVSLNVLSKVKELNVWFDVTMIDKVLFNLLSNAFKFTSENGYINVTITKSGDGKMAIIKIEDSGIGMTADDVKHAFDLFYQGHSGAFKGTGLGLSLSKELISLHHGSINISSEKGRGTAFEIMIPVGNSHLSPEQIICETPVPVNLYEDLKIYTTDIEPAPLQNEERLKLNKENSILIIEDNPDLSTFLERRLGQQYEIYEADNAEKGVVLAFDIVPDLIISDIILPGLSGIQLTEKLKQDIRSSHIPIILLTAKNSMEEQIKGIKSRADAFIIKPFNLEYLEETIKNLLNNRVVLREHYTSELPIETRANSSSKIDRKFINEFTSIVENNLSNEDFSVDDICRKIGISKVQLYRKVKALIGYNVNDYILNVRMQKAKFLLKDLQVNISEVAFKVGFASQSYFSTVFKSRFSITPSEYRERKRV